MNKVWKEKKKEENLWQIAEEFIILDVFIEKGKNGFIIHSFSNIQSTFSLFNKN